MVRKGWSVMDVPSDGWVKVLRGRRPPSVQWPPAQRSPSKVESNNFSGGGGRWRKIPGSGSPTATNRVRSFQAALKVLGLEEKAVREGLEASLQRAKAEAQKPSVRQRISLTPDFVVASCSRESCQVGESLEFLQGTPGEEVDAIKIASDRARVAAQEKPLTEQIADCKGFVERAQKRLVKLEAERDAENALLEEGRARLARLEAQAARVVAPPPPAPTAASDLDEGRTGVATDPTGVVDAFCCGHFCEVMRQHVRRSFRTTLRWFQVILRYGLRGVRVGGGVKSRSTRRSTRLQGVRVDHRRGLVVEVAPNVVDATAVDLSDVMNGENDLAVSEAVPVFNPMDSDEEDEFDRTVAQSRSIEDAPRRPRVQPRCLSQHPQHQHRPLPCGRLVNTPVGFQVFQSQGPQCSPPDEEFLDQFQQDLLSGTRRRVRRRVQVSVRRTDGGSRRP